MTVKVELKKLQSKLSEIRRKYDKLNNRLSIHGKWTTSIEYISYVKVQRTREERMEKISNRIAELVLLIDSTDTNV